MTRVLPRPPGASKDREPITVRGETARCLTSSPSTTVTPYCVQATCSAPDGTTGLPPVSGTPAVGLSDDDFCTTVAEAGPARRRAQAPASTTVDGPRPRALLTRGMELDPAVLGGARV